MGGADDDDLARDLARLERLRRSVNRNLQLRPIRSFGSFEVGAGAADGIGVEQRVDGGVRGLGHGTTDPHTRVGNTPSLSISLSPPPARTAPPRLRAMASELVLRSSSSSSTLTANTNTNANGGRRNLTLPLPSLFPPSSANSNSNTNTNTLATGNNIDKGNMAQTRFSHQEQERPARRKVVRIEAQDGPWSVSVAENPDRKGEYSIYVKSTCPFLSFSLHVFRCFFSLCHHILFGFFFRLANTPENIGGKSAGPI